MRIDHKYTSMLAILFSFFIMQTSANTLELLPSGDTTLSEKNYDTASGDSPFLLLQVKSKAERVAIKFDLSALTNIDTSEIQSAVLQFSEKRKYVSWPKKHSNISAHRLLNDWNESSATWDCPDQACANNWVGGLFESSGKKHKKNGKHHGHHEHNNQVNSIDVTADVIDMINNNQNYGWLIRAEKKNHHSTLVLHSRESDRPPVLTLSFKSFYDIHPPSVNIVSPSSNIIIDDAPQSMTVRYQDEAGVDAASVRVFLDGVDVTSFDICEVTESFASCPLGTLQQGIHTLHVEVSDNNNSPLTNTDTLKFLYLNSSSVDAGFATKWHTGESSPSNQIGDESDFYLNKGNGDVYQKLAGEWIFSSNLMGPTGLQGEQGVQGLIGEQGLAGEKGEQGVQGLIGEQGLDGEKGEKGEQGESGIPGLTGEQGLRGQQGVQGIQGVAGDSVISNLNCTIDQIAKFDGAGWVCAAMAASPLMGLECNEGDSILFLSGAWSCGVSISLPSTPEVPPAIPVPEAATKKIPIIGVSDWSSEYPKHNPASGAADGVLDVSGKNTWVGLVGDNEPFITFDIGAPKTVFFYRLARAECHAMDYYQVGTWKLSGSVDGIDFVEISAALEDQIDEVNDCMTFSKYYEIASPGDYRYYRFDFKQSESISSDYGAVSLSELELWE